MTASDVPVGVGGTAPTGDHPDSPQSRALLNAVSHARGVLTVEVDTLRRERNELKRALEVILEALDGADEILRKCVSSYDRWEIDNARLLAAQHLDHLKDDR